jgi:hypothetical protein
MPATDPFSDPKRYLQFIENQKKITPEMLIPFRGLHVAWNAEGTRIVAWGETYEAVYAHLDTLGLSGSEVAFDYVPHPGEPIR